MSEGKVESIARHRVIAGFVAVSALLLIILNVMCQRLVVAGLATDRLVFDHVNDAMVVPVVAGILIAWRGHVHWLVLTGVAAILTVVEFVRPTDVYDIAIYWLMAGGIFVLAPRSAHK